MEAFFAWAKEIKESGRLIKGKTLEGINYCINQEEALKVFLDDGEVPLDNNATEGALRSFCLHKHAWKLIDSLDGANASAIIYSITETAKANNLNPFRYLEHVLTVMKDHQEDTDYRFMEGLLPWSEQLPEICRSKTKTTNVNRPPETAVKKYTGTYDLPCTILRLSRLRHISDEGIDPTDAVPPETPTRLFLLVQIVSTAFSVNFANEFH